MNSRIAGVLLLSWPLVLHANTADDDTRATDAQSLDRVVVTANRTPQAESDTLAPTTVITRADIERLQAESVTELLRRSPGINVANEGGPGKLTSVYMRGTESDHVLVLVDGVRYGDATSGIPAIQDLPVGQIERIEIVRGPRSSLYGADAIGGVIQIFTRDGGEGTKPYFSAGTGSHDRHQGRIGLSGGDGRLNYNVSYGLENTDGFDACDAFSACFADEPDDDGYERIDASARVGYRFSDALRVDAHALHTRGDVEFDGSTTNESENTREVYGLSVTGRPAGAWRVKLAAGHNRDESESFLDGSYVNTFETERDTLSLQNDITLAPGNLLTLGLDYRREELTSSADYKEDERDNKGVFAQYLGRWGRHEIQLAGRGDDNEQFGEHATGSATYGFDLTGRHTVSVSYGTAFKAPTFNELYYPDFPG
ncbi:TonB-dependent receptor [Salinisphaera sp. PC39]|uniref:TonB-dependent receptor domain-containing protein n=1 Tax=Salinisphaera sp. PC39 TaxID=1304156 RepID=UPI00333F6FCC